mgnify:CR=1 FL=1
MNPFTRLLPAHTTVDEQEADSLARPQQNWYSVTVHPPANTSQPASLTNTIRGLLELQTKWFSLRNASPTAAYEIRRTTPDTLRFQFALPTKRLERKLRTHLTTDIPDARFEPGRDGIQLTDGDSIGGAILTTGRRDWYPLKTDHDQPPINSLAAALHRHAMQDTRFVIQILFQPVIGQPLRSWYRTRRTYQHIGYLRKQKERLWGSREPTPRERQQADAIEQKAGSRRFHTSIRLLVIGAEDYTQSRVKEVAGAFNVFESQATGQYLNTATIRSPLHTRFQRFAAAITDRRFGRWHHRFQATVPELAALASLPNHTQENLNSNP